MNFLSTNEFRCPHCESLLDAAAGATPNDKPKNNDITVCVECAGICVYVILEGNVSLRKITDQEIDELKQEGMWFQIEDMVDFVKSKPKK